LPKVSFFETAPAWDGHVGSFAEGRALSMRIRERTRKDWATSRYSVSETMPMSEPEPIDLKDDLDLRVGGEGELHPADLLVNLLNADSGGARRGAVGGATAAETSQPPVLPGPQRIEEVQPAARAFAAQPASTPEPDASGLVRAVQAVRSAWPLIQRLLPLLDGNVITAVTNLLTPRPAAPLPAKAVDIGPLESGIAELKAQQREMRGIVVEQDLAVKRLVEQLDLVRQATDRNTSEQQDLIDELKAAGKKLNIVAFLAFALLAASIALNVVLYLHVHRLLP